MKKMYLLLLPGVLALSVSGSGRALRPDAHRTISAANQPLSIETVLLAPPRPASFLEVVISGKVTDLENDEPLPGVNIPAKGTTEGTVTDVDGNYRLTVADNVTTLVFSSIGYTFKEVPING